MKGQNRVIQAVDDTCVVKEPSAAYRILLPTDLHQAQLLVEAKRIIVI